MNFKEPDSQSGNSNQNGYKIIFEDIEQKYIYFVLKAGEMREIPRNDLVEMIKSGKPMPIIEIKENFNAAFTSAES